MIDIITELKKVAERYRQPAPDGGVDDGTPACLYAATAIDAAIEAVEAAEKKLLDREVRETFELRPQRLPVESLQTRLEEMKVYIDTLLAKLASKDYGVEPMLAGQSRCRPQARIGKGEYRG